MSASVVHPHSYLIPVTSKSLLAFSNELLELVIDDIEQPEHLLSLAKTCRSLYALIVPNHLSFRHIQTHISRDDIWTLLAEKPILAANVRILNLHGGDCEKYPRLERIPINFEEIPLFTCSNSTTLCDLCTNRTEEHISRFLSALQQMHNLSSLAISAYPIGQNRLLKRIFNALEEAQIRLIDFSVNYDTPFRRPENDVDEFSMPLNQLEYLHSLAVSTRSPGHSPKSLYHALMNNSAKSLSSIYILAELNVISGLFTVYWPLLRHFIVKLVSIGGDHITIPGNFLQRHINLETLRVTGDMPRLVAHPRLQSLSVENMLDLDYNLLPNIRHLSDSRIGNWMYYVIPPRLASLGALPFLESFLNPTYFSSADVALFVNNAPNIKMLSVYLPDFGSTTQKSKHKAMNTVNEFLVHLAKLKNLTHLAGFMVNEYFEIMNRRWPALVRHVAITIPSLLYLQVRYKGKAEWLYLERDGTGKYLRCFYLEERVRKVDLEKWGGFYYGRALR